jgi:quercetin dioxygenase-like cupin family protein
VQDDQPIIRMPGEGPVHRTPFGDSLTWKAGEADTDGHFSVHERTAPPGSRSTPHRHHELVEAFYMLEGECEFVIGDRTLRGGAGTFVLAPKATLHGWAVVGEAPVKMLVFFAPSAQLAFFDEQQALLDGGAGTDAMRALAERFHWT